jgi:opacity protein-like surface antigen
MKMKSILVLIALTLSAPALPAGADDSNGPVSGSFAALGRFNLLLPGDQVYREVYGKSLMQFGLELRRALGPRLSLWAEASYLSKTGALTFTKEETKLSVIPLEAGLTARLTQGKWAPYAGAGVGIFLLKEESEALGSSSTSPFGFCLLAGISGDIGTSVFVDFRAKYQVYMAEPTDPSLDKVNVGGLVLSGGVGFRF